MLVVQAYNSEKGLTCNKKFGVVPLGKRGDIKRFDVNGGELVLDYGATITDQDRKTTITCLSMALEAAGFDIVQGLKSEPLAEYDIETNQVLYTTVSLEASKISAKVYKGNIREGRQVRKSLAKIKKLSVDIEIDGKRPLGNSFSQIENIAFKDGIITFNVANMLLQFVADNILPFRIQKTLQYSDFTYRLSFLVETNQYQIKGKWFPQQTYSLDFLVDELELRGKYRNKDSVYIKMIQDAFDEMAKKDKDFPRYIYDKDKRFFYNKHKKSADKSIFS